MIKRLLIFSAAVIMLSLMAFGLLSLDNSMTTESEATTSVEVALNEAIDQNMDNKIFTDFIYDIGTRFGPIKKRDLDTLRSFNDIIGEDHARQIVAYKSVSVIIMNDDKQSDRRVNGNDNEFNSKQLEFLQSLDYSTNFVIWADYQEVNSETGNFEDTSWTPYLTLVPEKQAEYSDGIDALKKFLKEQSMDVRDKAQVDPEKLKPAKLYFTVTKNGTIEHVRLDRSSNYPTVDEKMIELIKNTPGTWKPAENYEGEQVDQELVVSFGLMGC